jgi:anti-sigma regulatory factor (Ser/Thr protein kinase)
LEEKDFLKEYLIKCSSFIDFNSRELLIDLTECTRIWPSAVTLLCSLWQWIELASRKGHKPVIAQAPSKEPKVNSYMHHCGLYEYVKIREKEDTSYYDPADVVKIQKEMDKRNIEVREEEIMDLVERHTNFDSDQLEWFNSVILTEVLNNVTEHGISHKDKGWWLLAQYHQRHRMISLCVADNGIGIRNTLVTGPQRQELLKDLDNSAQNDGLFIKKAMEENVSGAITASTKSREGFRMRYSSGSRRGNGLKRIQDCCKNLEIELTILSHNGCISLDRFGKEVYCGSLPNRVVAGTMYQLSIPSN